MKALERENREQRDFAQGVGLFCLGGARPPTEAMIFFIDAHRSVLGVEQIRRLLPIAPSTYYEVGAKRTDVQYLQCCYERAGDASSKVANLATRLLFVNGTPSDAEVSGRLDKR